MSRIQLACKFNQIIQLCFTLQKLRYKSTLINLGTMEALDKAFTNTNGKTLSTRVCSNTVQFLLNLIPLIIKYFILHSRDHIQITWVFTHIYKVAFILSMWFVCIIITTLEQRGFLIVLPVSTLCLSLNGFLNSSFN